MDRERQAPALLCSESVDRLLPGGGVDWVSTKCLGPQRALLSHKVLQSSLQCFEAVLNLEALDW